MTTATTSTHPEQGQMASVRTRNWMVTDVSASTLSPELLHTGLKSPQHFITLSSVEDDGAFVMPLTPAQAGKSSRRA